MSQAKRFAGGSSSDEEFHSQKKGKFDDPSSQLGNRYEEDSEGPFMVLLKDKRDGHNLGNIHPMVIGKRFKQCGLDVANINKYSEDRIIVLFNEAFEANEFIDNTIKSIDKDWLAYIPSSANQSIGIVRDVPKEINTVEVLEGISEESIKKNIVEITRIKEKKVVKGLSDGVEGDKENLVESDSIKIVFNTKLPDNVKIFCCVRKVLKFIPAVRRCFNCQRFGHTANRCRVSFRCSNCAKDHDKNIVCKDTPKCINCGDKHSSSDKSCVCFQFYKEVNKIKVLSNVKHNEAIEIVKNKYVNKILNGSSDSFNGIPVDNIARTLNLGLAVIPVISSGNKGEKSSASNLKCFSNDIDCNKSLTSGRDSSSSELNAVKSYSEEIQSFLVETFGDESAVLKQFKNREKEFLSILESGNTIQK